MTLDQARDIIAKERQLVGYWDIQRRGRNVPDQTEITLPELKKALLALLEAAQHVPANETEDVLRLVELTETRLKLKYGLDDDVKA
jgi:hypothetical protein